MLNSYATNHKVIREEDEEFVVRCYDELNPNTMGGGSFEEDRVLSEELDILVVESYASLPYREVEKVIRRLKNKKVAAIAVIHEGCRDHIGYNLGLFDALVVFDERYVEEIV